MTLEQMIAVLYEKGLILSEKRFRGEITLETSPRDHHVLLTKLKEEFGYAVLIDLTAVDYLSPPSAKIVYLLHNPVNFQRLRIVVFIPREGSVGTVTNLWVGAHCYEREVFDLFGIRFLGHPDLKRILMPEGWKGHPLKRDYALTEQPVAFKHGVKPKIPSELIPHVKNR